MPCLYSRTEYHCHLSRRWVACWRMEDETIEIEVYYAGTRVIKNGQLVWLVKNIPTFKLAILFLNLSLMILLLHLCELPTPHKDPFDRMLVCQSIEHSLTILTPDHLITQYPIRYLW